MYPYRKAQLDLFLTLVNESNPGLYTDLTSSNIRVGVPVVQAVPQGGIQNTNILMTAKGGDYLGTKRVQYRRINLASYFRNVKLSVQIWTSTTTVTADQLAEALNAKYGTALVGSDFSATAYAYGSPRNVTIGNSGTIQPLCYQPLVTLSIDIVRGKREISDVFTADTLDGRLFPGGNSFPGDRKPQGEYLLYGLDCSPIASTLVSIATNTVLNFSIAAHRTVLDFLQANAPALNFNDGYGTGAGMVPGGLAGLRLYQYALPQALIPEANSEKFARASYIAAAEDSWFQGNIILHNGLR